MIFVEFCNENFKIYLMLCISFKNEDVDLIIKRRWMGFLVKEGEIFFVKNMK